VFVETQPAGDVVEAPTLLELAEEVKARLATAGLLFTPYAIDEGVLPGIDASLELVDGARLRALVAHHLPDRFAELARYVLGGASDAAVAPTPTSSRRTVVGRRRRTAA
jgi:hypothetical protein